MSLENNLNSSKREEIKERIIYLLTNSTSHGLPSMLRARNFFMKIMWLIFFIISVCVGAYYTIDSTINYFKYSTLTVISVINQHKSEFPTISFCSFPSFNVSIDKLIINVNFERLDKTNLSHFEEFKDFSNGKCFRYNSGKKNKLLFSSKNGYSFGLRINIYYEAPKNFDIGELLVNIHNHTNPPYDMQDSGFWLRPGTWNYFKVERVFTKLLPKPYNNCLKRISSFKMNKSLINYISESNITYSQQTCYRLCDNLFALEKSNCNCNSSLKDFEEICFKATSIPGSMNKIENCILDYLKEFRKNFQHKECYQFCPLECDSLSFNINSYTESVPHSGNISYLVKKEYSYLERFNTYEEVNKHFIGLRIYYQDLKYTLITQEPKMETFNFISNIGGILGLFLGISFLSFIEVFEILFEIFLVLVSKYTR